MTLFLGALLHKHVSPVLSFAAVRESDTVITAIFSGKNDFTFVTPWFVPPAFSVLPFCFVCVSLLRS